MLDRGYVLCTHDLMMIDRKNRILKRNISRSYPKFLCPEFHWHTGDCVTVMSAFNPYICAQGMTILMRKAAAELLIPFPEGILQDRWLCMGAGQLGKCARIEEPLAAYRRHPHNSSGTFPASAPAGNGKRKEYMPPECGAGTGSEVSGQRRNKRTASLCRSARGKGHGISAPTFFHSAVMVLLKRS